MSDVENPATAGEGERKPLAEQVAEARGAAMEQMSDEEAAALAGPQLPVLNLALAGANLNIVKDEASGERGILVGPILLNVMLPLTQEAAREVARQLTGGIEIASGLPPKRELVR